MGGGSPEALELFGLPFGVLLQFRCHDMRHARRRAKSGMRIQEQRSCAPRQDIFYGAGHLFPDRPYHFCRCVRQFAIERFG